MAEHGDSTRRFERRTPRFAQRFSLLQTFSGTTKYLIGSSINASALGRIGIVLAWDQCRLRDLLRGREFLSYMKQLEKNSFDTSNLLFLSKDQFIRVLGNQFRT